MIYIIVDTAATDAAALSTVLITPPDDTLIIFAATANIGAGGNAGAILCQQ